jgi:hypothetical protein
LIAAYVYPARKSRQNFGDRAILGDRAETQRNEKKRKEREKKEKRKRKEKESKEKRKQRLSGEDCTAAPSFVGTDMLATLPNAAMSITSSQAIHCLKCYKTGCERAGTFDQCETTIR